MPQQCVFCAIVAGTAPATVVREWADAIAILPRGGGAAEGHVLVIPRVHVSDVGSDPVVSAATVARAAELVAELPAANLITSKGADATQTVFHLHVHVLPRRSGDDLPLPWTPHQRAAQADVQPVRTCSRCHTVVSAEAECPTCVAEFERRRDPAEMSTVERLAEFDSWFLARLPEISNDRVARRVAELVGHPVHPMDVATPTGRDALRREIVGGGA